MRIFCIGFLALFFLSCSDKIEMPTGHWHEIKNGKTVHCYHISDTLVSVDKFTFGYSKKILNGNIYESLIPSSSFELLEDSKIDNGQIIIDDSISWVHASNDRETFLSDLSIGLLVSVIPPELHQQNFDLPYDSATVLIYIGQLKSQRESNPGCDLFYIQINDVMGSLEDVEDFFFSHHCGNERRIAVINADRNISTEFMGQVMERILRTGYVRRNIYRTEIDEKNMTIGLVRCK